MRKFLLSLVISVLLLGILLGIGASGKSGPIDDARKHAEEKLLPLEGVAGISHSEETLKIIVYLEDEKHKAIVPKEIKGFETEVQVVGRINALRLAEPEVVPQYTYSPQVSRTGIVRPISGGISIGVPENSYGGKMAGTLGVVTKDPYILTNAHVIAMNWNANFLKVGTSVLQPGTIDGGTISNQVGKLYKYIPISFGRLSNNYADAAIAQLTTSEYLEMELLGDDNTSTYTISGTADASVGDFVRKSGRTTGVNKNSVTATSATVKVYYTWSRYAIFRDQILVNQPFIAGGDSGSLVDKGGNFVGLAFAGSSTIAVVCKAKYIVAGLGISV